MAITVGSKGEDYFGLSTDAKPSASTGSRFYETDTHSKYIYSGASWLADALPVGTNAQAPAAYRAAVVAADVIAAVGAVTLTDINAVGVFALVGHNVRVVAVNAHGRTTPSTIQSITPTINHQVKIAFAAVTGAVSYDVYMSIDAEPKWLAQISEAQRAAGCQITAVGTVGAGGAVGSAYANLVGTGLVAATTAAVNTAYSVPASPVVCTGFQYVGFDLTFSRTGDAVAPSLIVIPAFYSSRTATYELGTPTTITFGGTAGVYNGVKQRLQVEARGCAAVALLVASIAGTGASLDVDAVLS